MQCMGSVYTQFFSGDRRKFRSHQEVPATMAFMVSCLRLAIQMIVFEYYAVHNYLPMGRRTVVARLSLVAFYLYCVL